MTVGRHNRSCKSPCVFARGRLSDGENGGSGLKRVFVEQDGQFVAVSVGVELARKCGTWSLAFWIITAWKLPWVALRLNVGLHVAVQLVSEHALCVHDRRPKYMTTALIVSSSGLTPGSRSPATYPSKRTHEGERTATSVLACANEITNSGTWVTNVPKSGPEEGILAKVVCQFLNTACRIRRQELPAKHILERIMQLHH